MMNNLIIKFNKEGHRVYLITGNRSGKDPYQKVFERYDFDYDYNALMEIFRGINLDLTIYMGAFDTNYDWENEDNESVRYAGDLANIMMAYAMKGQGRFIYLSSDDVFGGNYAEDIMEDMQVSPIGFRNITLAQAEAVCDSYRKDCNLDVVTLRADHIYGIPRVRREATDICSKMCLEAMDKSRITVRKDAVFSMLFERDAVEFIYRLATSKKHNSPLYNISSSAVISERELAELVANAMGASEIEIVEVSASPERKVLSNILFESEFGNPFLCDRNVIVRKVAEQIKKNRHVFLYGEDAQQSWHERMLKKAGWLFEVMIPFVENMILFIPFFMLNNRAVGSQYFANLDFYLLYVLLFAIVYGQQQAAFSAVLAVAGYCFRQMYDRSGFEIMLDANTYVWIAQLFILGLVVGYMRDRITMLKRESETERKFLSVQLHDIQDINSSNVRVKDALETQIINQNDSVGKIHSIISRLDQYSPEEVLFYAAEMIGHLVKSNDVAIYVVSNSDYARLFSATSEKARAMGNSIKYAEQGEMSQILSGRNVFINRRLDEKLPLMANAIYDDSDKLQMIIMIWSIPWENMTLGQANQLVVISSLIQNAVVRANRYLAALEEKRYEGDTPMLKTEAFKSLMNAYLKAKGRGLAECNVLKILVDQEDYLSASRAIMARMRQTDYIGTLEDGGLYLLLPNTKVQDTQFVIKRLDEIGYDGRVVEDFVEWQNI